APGHARSPFRRRALWQPQHAGRPAGRGSTGPMIAFDEALAIVADVAAAHRLPAETRSLSRAHGHVLARDVTAPIALPPFDNSAMEGFALRSTDLSVESDTVLRLAGEQFAGPSLALAVRAGECVRITTGAPLPAGADAIA